jgi:hypothetical protein
MSDTVAWRTLADIDDAPPPDLILGMLEHGPNLMVAAPGVGKGTTGSWLVCQALEAGMRPLIYDAERRPREWARRVSGLGGDRSQVVYCAPDDMPTRLRGAGLVDVAAYLGVVAAESGADLLLVDSILAAVSAAGVGEDRLKSDAAVPWAYVAALEELGIPSLSFGHPPKGQPEGEAFGSGSWTAAMRMTWSGTRAEGDGHRIRWKPKKRNERGHIPGVLLTVEYGIDGRPCAVTAEDDEASTRDWLLYALKNGPRGVTDLADEMADELEDHVTADHRERIKERLNKALRRMSSDGSVEKDGNTGRNVKWRLRWAA